MSALNRYALRRLRILQKLQMGDGEWLSVEMILRLLLSDPDLEPDMTRVLRSLIWLEDQGLVDVNVVDGLDDETTTFARITAWGDAFLRADSGVIEGLYHPAELLELIDG